MAAGDISAVTINADGRSATIRVLGAGAGGTYLYDAANSTLVVTASAKIVFTVVSKGFTSAGAATTITRTVYGTRTQREPGTTDPAETEVGADVDIEIALSEPIYAKDKAGVGNSGTDPTVVFLAGWYTEGVVISAAGTPTVTNNSTLAYAVPFGRWDYYTISRTRQTANFRVAFTPRHLHGIACTVLSATGATSAHSQSSTVTAYTSKVRARSGLYAEAMEATLAIAGFTQAEKINLRATVYPLVGDVDFDTTDDGSALEADRDGAIFYVCDKNGNLPVLGIVNSATGDDGTGATSTTRATAEAAPYATIKAAFEGGATRVELIGNSHSLTATTPTASPDQWFELTPHSTQAAACTVSIGADFCTFSKELRIDGVTIASPNGNRSMYGAGARRILYGNVLFDDATQLSTYGHSDGYVVCYYIDCESANAAKSPILGLNATELTRMVCDGCEWTTPGTMKGHWEMVACRIDGTSSFIYETNAGSATIRNLRFEHNKITKATGAYEFGDESGAAQTGYSIIGNQIEGIDISGNLLGCGQLDTTFDQIHVVIAHNTVAGQRTNLFYNWTTEIPVHTHIRHSYNIYEDFNTKHDKAATVGATRINSWWFAFGTCQRGNVYEGHTFPGDYEGIGSVVDDPEYTSNLSGDGQTGGGDYSLGASSPARNKVVAGTRVSFFDFNGEAIPNDGTGAAGAIQPEAPDSPASSSDHGYRSRSRSRSR